MPHETVLWNTIRILRLPYAERIEAKAIGAGLPDMHLVFPGDESWFVEAKRVLIYNRHWLTPPQSSMLAKVRPSQIRWHTLYAKVSKRSCFLLVDKDHRRYAVGSWFASQLAAGTLPVSRAVEINPRRWTINGLHDAFMKASDASLDSAEDSAGV